MDGAMPLHWRRFPERYRLLGSYCEHCRNHYFPRRLLCPACRRKGKMKEEEMPREGKIVSYTKVHVGPMGFEYETPYFLALIELKNGARVLSQVVDSEEKAIKTGARVKKVFRKIQDTDAEGAIAYGYKFKVVR